MLLVALVLGLLPSLLILALAIVLRVRAAQRVASPGPQFAPAPGAIVLHDALLLDADRRAIAAALIDLVVRRKVRLLADVQTSAPARTARAKRRVPVGIEVIEGAEFTPTEARVLEALFGPGHTPGRVRRFSADGRALRRRIGVVLRSAQRQLSDAGLLRPGRRVWPVVLLRLAAVILIPVTVVMFGVALGANAGEGDGAAFGVSFLAFLVAVAALIVTPSPWRSFLPPARPLRVHLAGLRDYIALAEAAPLRFLQSADGAELRGDVSAEAKEAKLERFLLNERLLPYAVLFRLEASWAQVLRSESEQLRALDGVEGVLEVTGNILEVIELVGGVVRLVAAVGDLVDVTGGVLKVVGGVVDVVSS